MDKTNDLNTKDKILKTAVRLFAQKGFDGVSIREICKEADVNICLISYYFGGKKELYSAIIETLIERQTQFAQTFLDFSKEPYELTHEEQIENIMQCIDKFVDFFYSNISSDLIVILLKEQQKKDFIINSPVINYFRKLIACILKKDENDRETILKTLFIISQINSPRILPAFSLSLLGQDEFIQEDIKIIKDNVKFYVNALIKEADID